MGILRPQGSQEDDLKVILAAIVLQQGGVISVEVPEMLAAERADLQIIKYQDPFYIQLKVDE